MNTSTTIRVRVEKRKEHFTKIRDAKGSASGIGKFSLNVKITALQETIFVPLSVASGKKPAGFVYQIEGTGESKISTTDISLFPGEEGITQVLVGTITYCKILPTKTATFRIRIEMNGKVGKAYSIAINQIRYKLDPTDARYKTYEEDIRTGILKFR